MLELYIACHHPFREKRDATDVWAKGHTDLLDPNRISPDEQPIFDVLTSSAACLCSVPQARCSELPAAQNIVAFTKGTPLLCAIQRSTPVYSAGNAYGQSAPVAGIPLTTNSQGQAALHWCFVARLSYTLARLTGHSDSVGRTTSLPAGETASHGLH